VRLVRKNAQLTLLVAVGLGAAALSPASATGQEAGATTTIVAVADGLNAPRGVVYDADQHRVLVAEAGAWFLADGTQPCAPAERGLPFCLGHSGSILQYSESGAPSQRVVTGLPSASLQIEGLPVVIGLHDLTMHPGDDKVTAVFGTLGNRAYRDALGAGAALLGQAVTINQSGKVTPFADLLSFINTIYPNMEGDPYGVVVGSYGAMVANAGGHVENGVSKGNDLLKVSPSGTITEVAQFPARAPAADPTRRINTVPTSVARGPDGAFYVGELTGAPFYPNEARVWRVVPGQPPTVFAQGFTTIVDLVFDEQGRLLVLGTAPDPFDTEGDGTLTRIESDGQHTMLFGPGDDVNNPGGVAPAGNGVYYVTSKIAGSAGTGALLKITVTG
jgi:hypothetical protein